jgi:Sulfotransferase domain
MDKYPPFFDDPHHRFHHRRPGFLVISPPKTGSTWLAANLRHHPEIFIPKLKEIKYFNSLYKWLDFGWYCTHFDEAGSRLAGEASPSYAALSLESIEQLHRLFPDLKLVYLMRDPISRAWSHAKHNCKYREANFAESGIDTAAVTDDQWRENFYHEWTLTSGDYLGQLRRWLSVFSKEQLYVGFYESIVTEPSGLLRDILRFLNVDPNIDLSGFPLEEHFLPGSSMALTPSLASTLHSLLQGRTEELAAYLRDNFKLALPPDWQTTLGNSTATDFAPSDGFPWEAGEGSVARVMAMEETFPSAFRFVEYYRGFTIVIYRGQMYSLPSSLGPHAIIAMDQSRLKQLQADGTCITGRTLAEVKERITSKLLERAHSRIEVVESQLQAANQAIARSTHEALEAAARVAADLHALNVKLQQPTRMRRILRFLLGPTRRRFRAFWRQSSWLPASLRGKT